MCRVDILNVVLPAVFSSATRQLPRLEVDSVKACFLTMRAAEVWYGSVKKGIVCDEKYFPFRCPVLATLR